MNILQLTITESVAFHGNEFRLDKEAGIAYGVAVCGATSLHGRDYPAHVRDRDKKIYEGVRVYPDHNYTKSERSVSEFFGKLQNVRTRASDGKTIADLHYSKSSSFTPAFIERCERFPDSLGLSHDATVTQRKVKGRMVVESIDVVRSVDIVDKAATNPGIFESFPTPGTPMKFKDYVAAFFGKFPNAESRIVFEGMALDVDMPSDTPTVADAADAKAGLRMLCAVALHESTDSYAEGKIDFLKFSEAVGTIAKVNGIAPTPAPVPINVKESAEFKALQKENADLKLSAVIGNTPLTEVQRKALTLLTEPAEQKALMESFRQGRAGQKPESGSRLPGTPDGIPTDTPAHPVGSKSYLERIKNRG